MRKAKFASFHALAALVLMAVLGGTQSAAQNNGVTVDGVVRSGAGDGVSGAQIRLIGPIIEDPTTYTPNPALTAEMRERIERFMVEARQMNAGPELAVNRALRMEAEFLGLPMPPQPQIMGPAPETTALADGDGRFTFRNVRPGRYNVRAAREGYWGAVRPGAQGAPPDTVKSIDVVAGPTDAAVSLVLIKGGAVSGRALDSDGRALSGFNVTVFRPTYQDTGRAVLTSAGSKTTDELGQYRFLLPPGEYYAAGGPRRPGETSSPQDSYIRTFYPNMVDARTATRLALGEAAELAAIDITVNGAPTRKISGRVVIVMQSKENYPAPYQDAGRNFTYDPAVGFVFRGVPDGRFVFRVESQSGEALLANAFIADVREAGAGILDEGLTLSGKPPGAIEVLVSTTGGRVTGTVRDAGQKPVAAARVVLAPVESRRQNLSLFKSALSDAAGNFSLEGIAPGDYKLFAWENVPLNAYLNAEFLANYELRGQAVTVKAGVPVKIDLQAIPQKQP